jgi:hypothetical protein
MQFYFLEREGQCRNRALQGTVVMCEFGIHGEPNENLSNQLRSPNPIRTKGILLFICLRSDFEKKVLVSQRLMVSYVRSYYIECILCTTSVLSYSSSRVHFEDKPRAQPPWQSSRGDTPALSSFCDERHESSYFVLGQAG